MNVDIRVLVSFKNHRKRKKLRRLIGDRSDSYLIDLWLTVAMDRPEGILIDWEPGDIADACNYNDDPEILVAALIGAGWLEKNDKNEFIVHNWENHQGWACGAKKRSISAKKAAKARWDKKLKTEVKENATAMLPHSDSNAICNAEVVKPHSDSNATRNATAMRPHSDSNATRNAEVVQPQCESNATRNAPSPSPSPSPSPQQHLDISDQKKTNDEANKKELLLKKDFPFKKIKKLYEDTLTKPIELKIITEKHKKEFKDRWHEDPKRQEEVNGDLIFYKTFFETVERSDYLTKRKHGFENNADLLFLMKKDNFEAIVNGQYGTFAPNDLQPKQKTIQEEIEVSITHIAKLENDARQCEWFKKEECKPKEFNPMIDFSNITKKCCFCTLPVDRVWPRGIKVKETP